MAIDDYRKELKNVSRHTKKLNKKSLDSTFPAYVVDVIDDPKRVDIERKEIILKFLHKKESFDYFPGKTVIFAHLSDEKKIKGKKVFFALPFMSPHFSQPINAGEMVWIINYNNSYYWVSRKTSLSNLEDINYTSGLRKISDLNATSERSNIDIANGNDQTLESTTPDFPLIYKNDETDEDFISLLTFFNSHSSKNFIGEPIPGIKPAGNDFVLQGSNNTSITLGNNDYYKAGNIELTAGITTNISSGLRSNDRGLFESSKRIIENQNIDEGKYDYINDLSHICISMNENGDEKFGLEFTNENAPQIKNSPFIVGKSTEIRLVGRDGGSIRLIKEGDAQAEICLMSDGSISIEGRRAVGASDRTTQPTIRGEDLAKALDNFSAAMTIGIAGLLGGMGPVVDNAGVVAACSTLADEVRAALSDEVFIK